MPLEYRERFEYENSNAITPKYVGDRVAEIAYIDRGIIEAPFDVLTIPIGSHKVDLPNWDDVENAPTNLPSSGHFLVHEGDNDKVIRYISNETSTFSGITSRTAELVITEDVAEAWSYYASSADTYSSGEVAIASKYDKGKATELGYKTLRAEYVKQYAYLDKGLIAAPFDVAELGIGSYRFEGANWNTIDHAPTNLPSSGHFLVWQSNETTKVISYVADTSSTTNCVTSRAAELVVIEGVAETWNYYASSDETYNFGEIAIPSKYDKGKATKLGHKTLHADYVRQYAYLNRGKRTGAINFNTSLNHGNTYIEFGSGSIEAPPTTQNIGRLQVEISGCVVTQYWYPDGSNALFFRERSAAKVWGSWYTATAGNVLANDKVQVPTFYKRGIASGYQYVNVYSADKVDELAQYTAGIGISINNRVVSWTGTAVPFSAISPLNYDAETGVLSLLNFNHNHDDLYAPLTRNLTINGTTNNIVVTGGSQSLGADRTWGIDLATIHASPLSGGSSTQVAGISVDRNGRVTAVSNIAIAFPAETDPIYTASSWYSTINNSSNWNTAYSWGNYATRNLTVQGTSGRVSVSGGMQSLAADRSWAVDLVAVHAGLSGGSTTQVPQLTVDAYGRTTGLTLASIAFPVTSVNGQTGAVSLTTTNIAEGTNLYWTTARGDARYSPLGHNHNDLYPQLVGSYANPSWITSLAWSKITGVPDFAGSYVPLSRALNLTGSSRILVNGGNQTLAADRAWSFDLASIHVGLSGGSSISTPSITVDAYGRVTAMTYSTILFPVTSVNGKTGAVSLSTTDVPEGTNLYWTNARGDARYSLLGHTHTWNDISGKPDFAGTYAPLSRSLTINGTTNNIVVSGGAQTLGADRVWTVNLAALHANPLTGGSTTQVPQITTDVFGRVTGIANANIAFPVTSVNGQTGAVALTTTNIPEGTNLYWTNARGDARYSLLGHSHTWNDISGKPTTFTPAAHTHPYTEITGISAGTGITYISGVIASTITQYTDTMATAAARAAFSAGTSISISPTGVISYTGAAGVTGSGTLNYVPKFSGASALTNSQIFDNGSGVAIGTTDPGGVRLRVNGAIYADGDGSAVAVYIGSGQAIRSLGNMFFDSPSGVTYFRTSGYAYAMTLSGSNVLMGTTSVVGSRTLQVVGGIRSTGQMQLADYTSSSSFGGTRAGLLGFDSSGNVLTVSNDTFAPLVHNHNGDYYTKSQVDGFLGGKADWGHTHIISNITGLQAALDGKANWGHTHSISDVTGLQSALDGKTPWGHTHAISDVTGLQGALDSKLSSESDPWGFDSHWFSVSGSTVTLGIQRRNGSQAFANFNVPSGSESDPKGVDYHTLSLSGLTLEGRIFRRDGTSSYTSVNLRGPFVTNASGYQNNIYSDNNFYGNTMVSGVLEVPSGIRMGGASWLFQNTYNHGATPGISSDTIPVVINGVTRYILLKS
jgi:hypothetical protein